MKIVISEINVKKMAKITAVVYFFGALIMAPFYVLTSFNNLAMLIPMILMLLSFPLMGFVGGAVLAFVYNFSAKKIGGVELTVNENK